MKFLSKFTYLLVLLCGVTCATNLSGAYLQIAELTGYDTLVPTGEYLRVEGDSVLVTQNKSEATRFKCFFDPERQRIGFCEITLGGRNLVVDDSGCFQLIALGGRPSDLAGWIWRFKPTHSGKITDFYVYEVEGCSRVLIRVE